MRGAPQSAFARLISPMSVRSSAETFGLPTRLRDRQRQYARNPARCQRMMVSGLPIATDVLVDFSPVKAHRSCNSTLELKRPNVWVNLSNHTQGGLTCAQTPS